MPENGALTPAAVQQVVNRSYQQRKIHDALVLHAATLEALGTDVAGLKRIVDGQLAPADDAAVGPDTQGLTQAQFDSLGTLYTQVQALGAAVVALTTRMNAAEATLGLAAARADEAYFFITGSQVPFNTFVSDTLADHETRLDAGGL